MIPRCKQTAWFQVHFLVAVANCDSTVFDKALAFLLFSFCLYLNMHLLLSSIRFSIWNDFLFSMENGQVTPSNLLDYVHLFDPDRSWIISISMTKA